MDKELRKLELEARKKMLSYRNKDNGNIIKKIERQIASMK